MFYRTEQRTSAPQSPTVFVNLAADLELCIRTGKVGFLIQPFYLSIFVLLCWHSCSVFENVWVKFFHPKSFKNDFVPISKSLIDFGGTPC